MHFDHLSNRDCAYLSRAVSSLYKAAKEEDWPLLALTMTQSLIPCEHISYNRVDVDQNQIAFLIYPYVSEVFQLQSVLEAHLQDHPFVHLWENAGVTDQHVLWSDVTSVAHFQETGLFQDFYRHVDTYFQAGILLKHAYPRRYQLIAINRLRQDFHARDRAMMDVLQHILVQADQLQEIFQVIRSRGAVGFTSGDMRAWCFKCNGVGRLPEDIPEAALRVMWRYFEKKRLVCMGLPDPVARWLAHQWQNLLENPILFCPFLQVNGEEGVLRIAMVPEGTGDCTLAVLEKRHATMRVVDR